LRSAPSSGPGARRRARSARWCGARRRPGSRLGVGRLRRGRPDRQGEDQAPHVEQARALTTA
jgi:hypothetical protein